MFIQRESAPDHAAAQMAAIEPVTAPKDLAKQTRIPQLDGVRGIAISLVLVWHYLNNIWHGSGGVEPIPGTAFSYVLRSVSLTWSGVDLFFVLSGFLIGGILLDNRQSKNCLRTFYIRRCFRILPLYALVLAFSIALHPPHPSPSDNKLIPIIWYASFSQNIWMSLHADWNIVIAHTWSLAVEEQFYLLLPLAILFFPPRRLLPVLCSLILAALAIRVGLFFAQAHSTAGISTYVLLPCRMDALLLGTVCAVLVRQSMIRDFLGKNLPLLYIAFGTLAAFPIIAIQQNWPQGHALTNSVGLTCLAALYACFILIAIFEQNGPLSWLTKLAPLRLLGRWAYCIYLIHGIIPEYLFRLMGRSFSPHNPVDWLLLMIGFACVLVVAALSWRFFEAPLIEIGHRWRYASPTPHLRPRSKFQRHGAIGVPGRHWFLDLDEPVKRFNRSTRRRALSRIAPIFGPQRRITKLARRLPGR